MTQSNTRLSAPRLARRVLLSGATAATLALTFAGVSLADAGSPLQAVLTRKAEALKAAPAGPVRELKARVTAESRSGVRRLRIRDFQYLSDSGRDFGGYNLGAGSWDTEVAVLASAVADEFLLQAAARGTPIDAIDVVFTSQPDDPSVEKARKVAYPRNLKYVAYIQSSASDADLEALRQAVEKASPVLNLVTEAQPIGHGEIHYTQSPAQRDPNLPPGLRDFLVEKRQAILRRNEKAKTQPSKPYALRAQAHVEPRTGVRTTRTGEGNFQILHDAQPELGGYGLAPTVEEHQLGVLATCLTHIFEIQAATRQVVLDSLEVRTEGKLAPRQGGAPVRYQNVKYSVHIESPAGREAIDGLRQAVEASCPVYNLLKDAQTIGGSIVRGAPPKS